MRPRNWFVCGALICLAVAGVRWAGVEAKEPTAGRKLALLVGVKKYDHAELRDLDFPENDVEELAGVLRGQNYAVTVLTTELGNKNEKLKPTAQNFRLQMRNMLKGVTKEDLIVVGLAGHGIQPLGSDESYFCPQDANPTVHDGKPAEPDKLVSMGEILVSLRESGVGAKLLFVDACRNDPSVRGRRGVDHVNVAALPSQTGVLLSCAPGEFSFEHKSLGTGHGVFFYQLIEGLKGQAAKDSAGNVNWNALSGYVQQQVPDRVKALFGDDGGQQNPNAIANLVGRPIVLARIPGRPERTMPPANPLSPGNAPELLVAPFDQEKARAARTAWAQYQQIDEERTNSIGLKLALIPAGEFQMGSTPDDIDKVVRLFSDFKKEAFADEQPQHRVRITQPFYLGKYEVTKGQFRKFVDDTGYRTDAEKDGKGGWGHTGDKEKPFEQRASFNWRDWGVDQSDESPVVNVSHNDALAFCEWLSKKEGKTYRLPTEAEWEYACRAGTTERYYNGDDPDGLTKIGNVADATAKEKFPNWKTVASSDGWAFTSPVGQFRPNNFGLYDMIGNAWEWCSDWYNEDYYTKSPESDPSGPSAGSLRVVRGGGWVNLAVYCRCANRFRNTPAARSNFSGFRLACSR